MTKTQNILIVAGEMSGDVYSARILRALKATRPDITAWGFGGDALAAEGMEIQEHVRDLSVMGFWEVLKHYAYFRRIFDGLLKEIKEREPDLVLLVDYPGFNLRLAEKLRHTGIPVIQYVCPQVWAWKKNRIALMEKSLTHLVCIFPFEPDLFKATSLQVDYCGHPMVDETGLTLPDSQWLAGTRLALVPGSRLQEIDRILEPMLDAVRLLRHLVPDLLIRLPAADAVCAARIREIMAQRGEKSDGVVSIGNMREVVKGADAAIVTSGTATLESCLLGTPMIIVYKTSPVTYAIGKRLITVPHIGMVNLVAGKEVCPEFIQKESNAESLCQGILPLLKDGPERERMLKEMEQVRLRLTSDKGGEKVAELLRGYLDRNGR